MGDTLQVFNRAMNDGINTLLAIGQDSVFVTWDGCVPWEETGLKCECESEDCQCERTRKLPGIIGAFRRVGKPYEYERGEFKVQGHDAFVIVRTSDVLAGKLRPQMIVTVQSRVYPDEPPKKYMVRMIDESGDTNSQIYLLDVKDDGTVDEPEPDEEPEPEPVKEMDRHRRRQRRENRW